MNRLEGKNAIITGAASGIGAAIAKRFAFEGANVALLDLNIDIAEKNAAKLRSEGKLALAKKIDLLDESSVIQTFGRY